MGHMFKSLFFKSRRMQYTRLNQISNNSKPFINCSCDEYGPPGSPGPKGFVAVLAGLEGEEKEGFLLPLSHLNHPLMQQVLVDAEEEFGCCYEGLITLPSDACEVKKAMDVIVRGDLNGKKLRGFP